MLKDKPRGKWVVVMNVQFQEEMQVPNNHMKRRSSYLAIEMQTETTKYFYLPDCQKPKYRTFTHGCLATARTIQETRSAVTHMPTSDGAKLLFTALPPGENICSCWRESLNSAVCKSKVRKQCKCPALGERLDRPQFSVPLSTAQLLERRKLSVLVNL